MIKELYGMAFVHILSKDKIIYNRITNPDTGKALYPDIVFSHPFIETAIEDSQIYEEYNDLLKRYKSAHCFVVACDDQALTNLALNLSELYKTTTYNVTTIDEQLFDKVCDQLQLSVTMRSDLRKLFIYQSTRCDVNNYMRKLSQQYVIPVSTKKEGKIIYELIRKDIIQ